MPTGRRASPPGSNPGGTWTFLTNHAHVLLCLVADADVRLRDVAGAVGITERAVQHIVADLAAAGVVERHREGRRNRYTVRGDVPLRHPIEAHRCVADLVDLAPAVLPLGTARSVPAGGAVAAVATLAAAAAPAADADATRPASAAA
jgi:hypothetical protein